MACAEAKRIYKNMPFLTLIFFLHRSHRVIEAFFRARLTIDDGGCGARFTFAPARGI